MIVCTYERDHLIGEDSEAQTRQVTYSRSQSYKGWSQNANPRNLVAELMLLTTGL